MNSKRKGLMRAVLAAVGSVTVVVSLIGCGGEGNPGVVPGSTDTKATRDFINKPVNPQSATKRGRAAAKKGELPPQPPK
jgi:hypothetical protein